MNNLSEIDISIFGDRLNEAMKAMGISRDSDLSREIDEAKSNISGARKGNNESAIFRIAIKLSVMHNLNVQYFIMPSWSVLKNSDNKLLEDTAERVGLLEKLVNSQDQQITMIHEKIKLMRGIKKDLLSTMPSDNLIQSLSQLNETDSKILDKKLQMLINFL